jgi:hypothetical protein
MAYWVDRVLLATTTVNNLCRKEYPLTLDVITTQLLSQNIVSLTLDGCTSTNILPITWVIVYYMDRNCTLDDVQHTFNKADRQFISAFEDLLRMTSQRPNYSCMASPTFTEYD